MKKNKGKLQTRLVIIFLLIGMIPASTVLSMSISLTTSSTKQLVGSYTEKIIEQLNYNIDNYIDIARGVMGDVVSSQYIQTATTRYQTLSGAQQSTLRTDINDKIASIVKTQEVLGGLYVCGQGNVYYQNLKSRDSFDIKSFEASSIYEEIKVLQTTEFKWFVMGEGETREIYLLRKVGDNEGYVVFVMNSEMLVELLDIANVDGCMSLAILDENNQVIHATSEDMEVDSALLNSVNQGESYTKAIDHNLVSVTACSNGWKIVSIAPVSNLMNGFIRSCKGLIGFLGACMLLIALLSIVMSHKITRPIVKMAGYMKKVQAGDFSVAQQMTEVIQADNIEVEMLVHGFISMLNDLKEIIVTSKKVTEVVKQNTNELKEQAKATSCSAIEVSHTTENITVGAMKQRDEMEETVKLIEELSNNVNDVNRIVAGIQNISNETMITSKETKHHLNVLYSQSENNIKISHKVTDSVQDLGNETKRIHNILEMIQAINRQTNLLALNASIEAVRAGESGKGFIVVAEEVRKLSVETTEALNKIGKVLEVIEDKRITTLKGLDEAVAVFNQQLPFVQNVKGTFENIYKKMNGIDKEIIEASACIGTVSYQKQSIQDKVKAITQIAEEFACIIEEVNATTIEQVDASKHISELASELLNVVETLEKCYV